MLFLSGDPDADSLLTTDPLALLIGMVLDQQIPLERAFRSPYDLQERLGRPLDAATLAAMDPEALAALFGERPALHRFPKSMAGRVQELCSIIVGLLGKQLGVRPPGWEKAASPFGDTGSFMSVADIDSPEALAKVRQYKQKMKAKAKATTAG